MFSVYTKTFAITLLCFTALSDLHAGGDSDEENNAIMIKPKQSHKVDEILVPNGNINYSIRYKNTPVSILGFEVNLDEPEASLKAHADLLSPDEVLVWEKTQPIEGDLREAFLKSCKAKKWGYGELPIDQALLLAPAEVIRLMRAMQAIGLEVTLRGDLTQSKRTPKLNDSNKLFVVGVKKQVLVQKPAEVKPAEPAPEPSPVRILETPKIAHTLPVIFQGQLIDTLSFADSYGVDEYPSEVELNVMPLEETDMTKLESLRTTAPTPYDPEYAKALESKTKEVFPFHQSGPTSLKPIIRRSWQTYLDSLAPGQDPVVVFFSGRIGGHTGVGGTDQSERYFLIDSCDQFGDVEPDYMFYVPRMSPFGEPSEEEIRLNTERRKGWSFWPDASVSRVVLDDRRFMDYREFPEILRILKPEGTLEFSPNAGMGFPTIATGRTHALEIGVTGTTAWLDQKLFLSSGILTNQKIRTVFFEEARKAAFAYFSQMGFSNVRWNSERHTFELVK